MKRSLLSLLFFFGMLFSSWNVQAGKYKILSIDGGGIRGVFTAQIIAMLDDDLHFIDKVDLFAGTSTGSFIAGSLAAGIRPKQIVNMYLKHGEDIFRTSKPWDLLGLYASYDADQLDKIIRGVMLPNNPRISDLSKKVIMPSVNLFNKQTGSWGPDLQDNFTWGSLLVVDAMLRSAAAPTYFPSHQGHVDGGLMANNPSVVALCAAIDPKRGNQHPSDVSLLSLGTGHNLEKIQGDINWGASEWVVYNPQSSDSSTHPLIDLMQACTSMLADQECNQMLGKQYMRLDPLLDHAIDLADWKQAPELVELAKSLPEKSPERWEEIRSWIKREFLMN